MAADYEYRWLQSLEKNESSQASINANTFSLQFDAIFLIN